MWDEWSSPGELIHPGDMASTASKTVLQDPRLCVARAWIALSVGRAPLRVMSAAAYDRSE